jgi:ABC-type Zn2+ transport system substrate-binding protein/surface adhesin
MATTHSQATHAASAPAHAGAGAHGVSHAAAHDHAHAHAHAHGDAHHGHHAHDAAGDKKAAFVGLVGGLALIGALVYGMVLWTNAQFAGHAAGGQPAAAAGAPAAH